MNTMLLANEVFTIRLWAMHQVGIFAVARKASPGGLHAVSAMAISDDKQALR